MSRKRVVGHKSIGKGNVKTEISVANPILEAAERLAKELGMSLSEFYVVALTAYMATYQNGDITKKTRRGLREGGLHAGARVGRDSDRFCG